MHQFYSGKFNFKLALIALLVSHCIVQSAVALPPSNNEFSFGLGLGALYAGLGVNFGTRSNYDFKYAAVGCTSVQHSSTNHTNASCGGSVGWLWTGVVSPDDRNHSFGIYIGPVEFSSRDVGHAIYGAGATYEFFPRGIDTSGWNFGATLATGRENRSTKVGLFLNAGYQF